MSAFNCKISTSSMHKLYDKILDQHGIRKKTNSWLAHDYMLCALTGESNNFLYSISFGDENGPNLYCELSNQIYVFLINVRWRPE